jgi:hypothetical protein
LRSASRRALSLSMETLATGTSQSSGAMANAALVTLRQFIRTEIHEILPAKQIQT